MLSLDYRLRHRIVFTPAKNNWGSHRAAGSLKIILADGVLVEKIDFQVQVSGSHFHL